MNLRRFSDDMRTKEGKIHGATKHALIQKHVYDEILKETLKIEQALKLTKQNNLELHHMEPTKYPSTAVNRVNHSQETKTPTYMTSSFSKRGYWRNRIN